VSRGIDTPASIGVGEGEVGRQATRPESRSAPLSVGTAHKLDAIVLDKTGTITASRPALTDGHTLNGFDEPTLLALVAAAERDSEHSSGHGDRLPPPPNAGSPSHRREVSRRSPAKVSAPVQAGTATQPETVHQQEAPMSASTITDPVCGMTIAADAAAASRKVDDTTYYFCSTHRAATFDADPRRYTIGVRCTRHLPAHVHRGANVVPMGPRCSKAPQPLYLGPRTETCDDDLGTERISPPSAASRCMV
jgi:YHS domain-containing protein